MKTQGKRVLVISYYYPPLGGAGLLKILRTTRYLSKFGWEPVVLTVKNPEPYHRAANPIPEGVKVFRAVRIPGGNLLARVLRRIGLDERWLLLPDQHILWLPGALLYGWYLIWHLRIDLIYVTGPPYSALIAGSLLKKISRKPLVVDVRDPWSFNAARTGYPTKLHRRLDHWLEKQVLINSDYITCIYQITEFGYHRLYEWTRGKTAVYYDTVDISDLPQKVEFYPVFTLTYLGTFYPPFASLKTTLTALRGLLDQAVIDPNTFQFNYVGPVDFTFQRLTAELGLEKIVRHVGYKPLQEAQMEVAKSHMLLLLLEFSTINTKLFDYFAAGRPILAVVPEFQELEDLLQQYASGYYKITDNDPLKVAAAVRDCFQKYNEKGFPKNSTKQTQFLRELNIETETQQLTSVFDKIISANRKKEC